MTAIPDEVAADIRTLDLCDPNRLKVTVCEYLLGVNGTDGTASERDEKVASDAEDLEREQAEQVGYRRGVMAVEHAVQRLLVEAPAPYRTPAQQVCGMVLPNACPDGAPVACAWKPGHLPTPHSWASLPTYVLGAGAEDGGS